MQDGLLLVKQYRPGTDRFYWALPAGYVKPAESQIDAARRELKEETGYQANDLAVSPLLRPWIRCPGIKSTAHVVLCDAVATEELDAFEEVVDVARVEWQHALRLVRSGQITEMQAVAAILFANDHLAGEGNATS